MKSILVLFLTVVAILSLVVMTTGTILSMIPIWGETKGLLIGLASAIGGSMGFYYLGVMAATPIKKKPVDNSNDELLVSE